MRNFILILGVLSLSGCSTLGRVPNDRLEKIKSIGVVSLLGNTFHGIYVGGTVFENKKYIAQVDDWKIDHYVSDFMLAELRATRKYQVGVVNLGTASAEDFYLEQRRDLVDIKKLSDKASKQNYDTIVLVSRAHHDSFPFHDDGYGFFKHCGLFNIVCRAYVYSLFTVEVVDVKSKTEIAFAWGYPVSDKEEETAWKKSFNSFSVEEREVLRKDIQEQIAVNVVKALQKLNLLGPSA